MTTELKTYNDQSKVTLNILRTKGCDGSISCVIQTQDFMKGNDGHSAIEHEHYLPIHEKVNFENGESEKQVTIQLVPLSKHHKMRTTDTFKQNETGDDLIEDQEESMVAPDRLFKVLLTNPLPEGVKISKKNICIVRISPSTAKMEAEQNHNVLDFFMQQKEASWAQ